MKATLLVALSLLIIPFQVKAITEVQAISLINIVQSSPNTPASAFTNLITAFSSVTVAQAESLITVVQAAPGVPASAFVNLLTSFTEDVAVVSQTTINDLNKKIEDTNALLGQIQQNTAPMVTPPVVVAPKPEPVKSLVFSGVGCKPKAIGSDATTNKPIFEGTGCTFIVQYFEDGKSIENIPITVSSDDGLFIVANKPDSNPATNNTWANNSLYTPITSADFFYVLTNTNAEVMPTFHAWVAGLKPTNLQITRTIFATANGLTASTTFRTWLYQ